MKKRLVISALAILLGGTAVYEAANAGVFPSLIGQSGAAAQAPGTIQQTAMPQGGSGLKDGTFTGAPINVFYGTVQIRATIRNGQLASVSVLQYPNDRSTSRWINSQALPMLKSEVLQARSANVNIISGATLTSVGYIRSLASALNSAGS